MPTTEEQVKEWQTRAADLAPKDLKLLEKPLQELDVHLTLRSFIVGYSLTEADTTICRAIRENHKANAFVKQGILVNVSRWFRYIEAVQPAVELPTRPVKEKAKGEKSEGRAGEDGSGGSYDIGLQDVEHGVITRFPPEPS